MSPRSFGHDPPRPAPLSPGARKEATRKRTWPRPARSTGRPRWVELRAASAFSFLEAASFPEDLVQAAAERELAAVALVDRDTLAGAPRFHKAARAAGLRALVGAEVSLESSFPSTPQANADPSRLVLLVRDREGYRNLCRLLTDAALHRPRGAPQADWSTISACSRGLHVLAGGQHDPVRRRLVDEGPAAARQLLEFLLHLFPGRVSVELGRHHIAGEDAVNQALVEMARHLKLPVVATGGTRLHHPGHRDLLDVLTSIRHHVPLDRAGRLLERNRERHLPSAEEMQERFHDLPGTVEAAFDLATQLDFTLEDLGYRFPKFPLPAGETPSGYLRQVTWEAARSRFRPLSTRAQAQIEHELGVIEKLDLAGYFLIVWDIVRFCRRQEILVQGRGSAANSAVCYALGITAVDPVRMDLLFERFLSEQRGEWPDIDLDLPSGAQREKVIQHLYQTYGERGAAMTANVITYRGRSAAREVGKALGFLPKELDRLSAELRHWGHDRLRQGTDPLLEHLATLEFSSQDPRVRHFARLWTAIQNLPRHLGQHSGGMVMAGGRLDEVVPLQPAAMEGRVILQWDKDDCADLGIVKVDLLGLGMLAVLEDAVPMIARHEKVDIDLAHLPDDDPTVWRMLQQADTVGVFQVESRAQMASLPRNAPQRFYDLVVQVAIIRPGPILGGLVHPYFERRRGRGRAIYPHPCLEPILERTLGVPIFQEQVLKMAMVAAGFSGGEAEELRRAMGFKRSVERMEAIETRLRAGMTERGIVGDAQEQVVRSITSFAMYGFPESHAASFALIAWASAWLKAHHPAAFLAALLNNWPMGFYHPATLIQDAVRHGVAVLPVDVTRSGWRCRWENGGVRLGLRYVRGLCQQTGFRIEQQQQQRHFDDLADLSRRCRLRADEAESLATAGAFSSFDRSRRSALWQVSRFASNPAPLFDVSSDDLASPLPEMTPVEETLADYRLTDLTTGPHLLHHLRPDLTRQGISPIDEASRKPDGETVTVAGIVIVRQRPPTARGFLFVTLEDETGILQAIIHPGDFDAHRNTLVATPALTVRGRIQKLDGTLSIKARQFHPLDLSTGVTSHDWH